MMSSYLYGFKKYAGIDKVWKTNLDFNTGDLIQFGEDFYLSLGQEISFVEQYMYEVNIDIAKAKTIYKSLLNKQTLELLHRMVYQRYSTYKNVVKLFLSQDIDKLIAREIKKKYRKNKDKQIKKINILDQEVNLEGKGQTLIIFPDIWTLTNLVSGKVLNTEGLDVLVSTSTQNQKDKSRWNIKNGNTQIILATHSEIFQNYKNLTRIAIVQPHKRYYANQQDPRYKTIDVVKRLAEIWGCELKILD